MDNAKMGHSLEFLYNGSESNLLSSTEWRSHPVPLVSAGAVIVLKNIYFGIVHAENDLYSVPYRYVSHFGVVYFDHATMVHCDQWTLALGVGRKTSIRRDHPHVTPHVFGGNPDVFNALDPIRIKLSPTVRKFPPCGGLEGVKTLENPRSAPNPTPPAPLNAVELAVSPDHSGRG
jgi:hypothetical protein